jgi:hypothetical protein
MIKKLTTFVFATVLLTCSSCVTTKKIGTLITAYDKAESATQQRIINGSTTPEVGRMILDSLRSEKSYYEDLLKKKPISYVFNSKLNKRVAVSFTTLNELRRIYDISTFTTLSTKKFFLTGNYKIPDTYKKNLLLGLQPLLNDIIKAYSEEKSKTVNVVIAISGYSDEQSISKGSALYSDLVSKLEISNPTQNELNLKLSELRAESLAKVIEEAILKRNESDIDKLKLEYDIRFYGRGVQVPSTITDPQRDDPRRRVVRVTWDVNPFIKK